MDPQQAEVLAYLAITNQFHTNVLYDRRYFNRYCRLLLLIKITTQTLNNDPNRVKTLPICYYPSRASVVPASSLVFAVILISRVLNKQTWINLIDHKLTI